MPMSATAVPYLHLVDANESNVTPIRNSGKPKSRHEVFSFKSSADISAISQYLYYHSSNTPSFCYRNYLYFSLGINMGLRGSDLSQLRWKHIFLPNSSTFNTTDWNFVTEEKTGKSRQVVLNASAQKAVTFYLQSLSLIPETLDPNAYVFKSRKSNPGYIEADNMRVIIKKAAKACGVTFNVGTHSLRKTFGYNLYLSSGKDIGLVQHVLNHSDPLVTTRYIGIDQEVVRDAYNAMDDLVWVFD